ncbi:MAG: AMP-binding protein [Bacillota bacterium]
MPKPTLSNHLIGKGYFKVRDFSDLREMLKQSAERFAEETAFKYRTSPEGRILEKSYSDFDMDVDSLGTALCSLGLQGKKIAIIGDNSYHWAVSYISIINGTGTVVPLDKMLPENEILGLLDRSQVSAIFYHPHFQGAMDRYAKSNKKIEKFISMSFSEKISSTELFTNVHGLFELGFSLLSQNNRAFVDAPINPEAPLILLYTSGTTNKSKAVMLCHRNLCADLRGFVSFITIGPGDVMLSILPLHHTFENTCGLITPLLAGACIAYCDGLRFITKNLSEFEVSYIIGVPLLFENMYDKVIETIKKTKKYLPFRIALFLSNILRKFGIDKRRKFFTKIHDSFGNKLRTFISGAAPLSDRVAKGFTDIGISVFQGYGLTETSPVIAGCNEHVLVHGTCGHPIEGIEVKIDSEAPGIPGEILVKGPIVMLGYADDPEATAEVIRDGWFHTGDIGLVEKHGLLKITGRLKSMIVLNSGKKIFPEEIETLLNKIPFIKESLVFANSRKDGETDVYARLVLDKEKVSQDITEAFDDAIISNLIGLEIKSINRQLPSFKSIKHFFFGYEEMPKTTTLKIKRNDAISGIDLKESDKKNIDKK